MKLKTISERIFADKDLLIFDFDGTIADTSHIHEKAFNDLNRHNNNKDCLWNQIFQGSIVNILTCKNCENKSLSFEPFYSLNMTPNISITEMFREYFKKENKRYPYVSYFRNLFCAPEMCISFYI